MKEIAVGYYRALEKALALRLERKQMLTKRYADAAVLGDDRENSPLDDARLAMEVNEGKIAELQHLLAKLKPVDDIALGKPLLGSYLRIERDAGGALEVVLIDSSLPLIAEMLPAGARQLSVEVELGRKVIQREMPQITLLSYA